MKKNLSARVQQFPLLVLEVIGNKRNYMTVPKICLEEMLLEAAAGVDPMSLAG